MEAAVAKKHLRWIGHTIRMPDHRLPRQVLYGQLRGAKRSAGGQKRRFKDYTRDLLKLWHSTDQPGRSLVLLQSHKYTKPTKTDDQRGAFSDTSGRLAPPWHPGSFAPSADGCAARGLDSTPTRSGTSDSVVPLPGALQVFLFLVFSLPESCLMSSPWQICFADFLISCALDVKSFSD